VFRLIGLVFVLLFLVPGPSLAQVSGGADELTQYQRQLNLVSQEHYAVMNGAAQLDEIALGIAAGSVSGQDARPLAGGLYDQLLARHNRATTKLDALGPGQFEGDVSLFPQAQTYFDEARSIQTSALDFLNTGMELVDLAIANSPDVFSRIENRRLETNIQNIHRYNQVLENERRFMEAEDWQHPLTTAILHQNFMMLEYLEVTLRARKSGVPVNRQRMMAAVDEHYDEAASFLQDARQNSLLNLLRFMGNRELSQTERDSRFNIFETSVTYSIGTENRLRELIYEFVSTYETLSSARIEEMSAEMTALEQQRERLFIERQSMYADLEAAEPAE